ncbi:MAG TPA: respiratory nitrate reductase subunit gamma [Candidatus Azoamicus sp. OHIO2]
MMLNKMLFLYYPYIAIFMFVIGSIYRYEYNQYSWKTSSSQFFEKKILFWGSNLFHVGIIFLLLGHFFGLLTPKFIYSVFITPEKKQIVAMTSGGIAGIICFIGLTLLTYRRFYFDHVYKTTQPSDVIVIILLYIQLILGLISIIISYNHITDPSSMIAFANWVQGIVLFSGDIHTYIINEHWIFKTHLFIGMSILLIFPFTRLVHIFSIPYLYILRDGYQIVRSLK